MSWEGREKVVVCIKQLEFLQVGQVRTSSCPQTRGYRQAFELRGFLEL